VFITPRRFTANERATHSVEGWIGSGFGLDALEKSNLLSLPRIELRLSSPERSNYTEYAITALLIKRSPSLRILLQKQRDFQCFSKVAYWTSIKR
jgi:hypothetical protein